MNRITQTGLARAAKFSSMHVLLQRRLLSSTVIPTDIAIKLVPTENIGDKAIANVDIPAGTTINYFNAPVIDHPTMHTVQFSEKVHVAPTKGAEFISHACEDYNTKIVVDPNAKSARFVAIKDIPYGTDLSFNYNTTEWDMSCPFECQCPSCQKKEFKSYVRGYKHLSVEEKIKLLDHVSPVIRDAALQETSEFLNILDDSAKVDSQEEEKAAHHGS